MSLRQQQVAVFSATVVVIFGILGIGIWWIAQRLTTEATLQTALLMARQVEIALADSLRERSIVVQPQQGQKSQTSFWSFDRSSAVIAGFSRLGGRSSTGG